ncbi:unnamed protein product, partial [Ectocarpus sp. 12 AP-2014]
MVAMCPLLRTRCTTYFRRVVGSMERSTVANSLGLRARPNPRHWPFTLSSLLHEDITTILSTPSDRFPRPVVVRHHWNPTRLHRHLDPVSGHRGLLMCGGSTGA